MKRKKTKKLYVLKGFSPCMSKGFSWSLDGSLGGFSKKYVAQKGPGLWIRKFSKIVGWHQ
jgi:hypothetical protein